MTGLRDGTVELAKPEIVVGAFDVGFAGFKLPPVTFPTLGLTLTLGIDGVMVLLWEDVGIELPPGPVTLCAVEGVIVGTEGADGRKVEGA